MLSCVLQDEPDPLDAFMAGNAAAVAAPPAKQEQQQADVSMADAEGPDTGQGVKAEPAEAAAAMEEDEVDPLDAFMAAEVSLPQLYPLTPAVLSMACGAQAQQSVL